MNKIYYKILILLIFFISLFLVFYEYDVMAKKIPKLLEGVIITIDPGIRICKKIRNTYDL